LHVRENRFQQRSGQLAPQQALVARARAIATLDRLQARQAKRLKLAVQTLGSA